MFKKIIVAFLCIICCIFSLNIQISFANENNSKNWYLKYGSSGEIPKMPESDDVSKKYDLITVDRSGEKNIYLTFDAGYENGNIERILDIMKKHDVKSAFFILPNLIKTNPEIILRLNNEGHLICNHTKSHRNMSKITDINEFKKELAENEKILYDKLNIQMEKYYRPPEGAYSDLNLNQAKELGYKTVFWSLAYADWNNNKQPDKTKALNLLLSRVHPGCVVLLHPTSSTNAEILEDFIVKLKEQGYIFKSLDEFPIYSMSERQ